MNKCNDGLGQCPGPYCLYHCVCVMFKCNFTNSWNNVDTFTLYIFMPAVILFGCYKKH